MRPRAWVLVLALVAGCGPGEEAAVPVLSPKPAPPATSDDRLAKAERLMGQERLAEAAVEYRAVLADDDKSVPALVGLSRIAGRLGDATASLQYLSKAAELRPDDGPIVNQLGVAQVACGRKREASETFERALRINPEDPLVYLNSAQNRADLGDWENAARFARRATELLPVDATPWLLLGRFEMRQEKYAAAVPFLREASRRAPDNAIVHFHLGKSLAASGQKEEARAAFQVALQGNPPPEVRKEVEAILSGR